MKKIWDFKLVKIVKFGFFSIHFTHLFQAAYFKVYFIHITVGTFRMFKSLKATYILLVTKLN